MPTFPFDPNARADRVCNAYCMAAAARAAYLPEPELGTLILENWQLGSFDTFESANIQGFVADGNGFTIIAFRGSDYFDFDDWVSNAEFDLICDPKLCGGQIHSGFQRGAESIWPQVQDLLARHRTPGHHLYLTGHSLGGALAILTAARFASESRAAEIDAIFTFGQPRAGDREFARCFDRDFNDRTFRYVNRYDLIPRLPPRLLGYDHVGHIRYFDEHGVLHENLSLWQQLMLALNPRGKDPQAYISELTERLPDALGDHHNARYVELLKDLCPISNAIYPKLPTHDSGK